MNQIFFSICGKFSIIVKNTENMTIGTDITIKIITQNLKMKLFG